jgi:hypothetical protein
MAAQVLAFDWHSIAKEPLPTFAAQQAPEHTLPPHRTPGDGDGDCDGGGVAVSPYDPQAPTAKQNRRDEGERARMA